MKQRISHLAGDWIDFFTKLIVASTVLNVLTSNRFRCGREESGYSANMSKKIPPAVRDSVHLGYFLNMTHSCGNVSFLSVTLYNKVFDKHAKTRKLKL